MIKIKVKHEEILKAIPHREPFLLVEDIVSFDAGEKKISSSLYLDPLFEVFKGHFPEKAIYPGVLMVEGLAQTGGILMHHLKGLEGELPKEKKLGFFAGIEKVRFKNPCLPGDSIRYEVSLVRQMGPLAIFQGKVLNQRHELCVEAEWKIMTVGG